MLVKDEGVVAHRMRYSESSWIVTWFAKERGIVKTIVKGGARRNFKMDLFQECRLAYRRSRSTHLHALAEAELLDPHSHVRKCYLKTLCLTYFFELVNKSAEPDTPIQNFYETFHRALVYLRENDVSERLVQRYERRVLKNMGLDDGQSSPRLLFEHGGVPKSYDLLKRELRRSPRLVDSCVK